MASADAPDGRPPYVQQRKGRWYWEPPARLRRSHRLRVVALGADTHTAWAAARKLNRELAGLDPDAPAPGTVRWLFDQFEASERFAGLAASTQGDYRWLGKRLSALRVGDHAFGRYLARDVRPRHADRIHAMLAGEGGPTMAHYACRYARRVWKWGARREFVDASPNPWSGMELPTIRARRQRWRPDQVEAFVAKAREPGVGRASLALAVRLAHCLGHRQGDVLTLTWADVDSGLRRTAKTGVEVPIVPSAYPELEAALAEARAAHDAALAAARAAEGVVAAPCPTVVVCESTGRAWQADVFRHEFRRVADLAGIPRDLQFRDLRATAATELADAGADVIELTTHTGHLTTAMARRYARRTGAQFEAAARKRRAGRERGEP